MGLDVIFENLYLDKRLRFGWYLDLIMLFILGDASLMFGLDSSVDMDDWDHTFNDGWFDVVWFSNLPHI